MTRKPAMVRKSHLAPRISRLLIVGVGGTGSYLAQGVAKLVAGYQLSLEVVLVDPDVVERKNCARQNFQPWEIGQSKSEALAYRLNQQYGLAFGAVQGKGEDYPLSGYAGNRLIVTCVDTVGARKPYQKQGPWLDLGNGLTTGQVIYGTTEDAKKLTAEVEGWETSPHVGHLPSPYQVAGLAKLKDPKRKAPGCADMPFDQQGIFVNEWASQAGLTILFQLLVKGVLETPALYFDCARGRMSPEYITREYLDCKVEG